MKGFCRDCQKRVVLAWNQHSQWLYCTVCGRDIKYRCMGESKLEDSLKQTEQTSKTQLDKQNLSRRKRSH